MAKTLPHLGWKPKWTSHLGCVKGCLDFLDLDASLAEIVACIDPGLYRERPPRAAGPARAGSQPGAGR